MTAAVIAPAVESAIQELERAFPGQVSYVATGDGGADVTVAGIELGASWTRATAPLTFNLAYNYPYTPVYPYYLPAGATPCNHRPQALQDIQWKGEAVVQVSLRHTNWDPTLDTALGSVLQVRSWAQQQ